MNLQKEKELLKNIGLNNIYNKSGKDKELKISSKIKLSNIKNNFLYKGKGEKKERYFLRISVKNSKTKNKELTVIMLNPSEKEIENDSDKIFVDKTITNVIKIAYENEYNQLNILNLITIIEPVSDNIKLKQITHSNIEFIKQFIESNKSDILVAWGEKVKNNTRNEEVKSLIEFLKSKDNVFTFCPNKKDFPKHPARIDFDCCKNCSGKNGIKLVKYNF